MKKKSDQPPVKGHAPRKSGLLQKAARVGASVVAARVAADTGKKGVIGLLAGMGAKRLILRYPAGALFVTGAYMAGKLYEAKRDADRKRQEKAGATALPDKSAQPILIEEARKARKG